MNHHIYQTQLINAISLIDDFDIKEEFGKFIKYSCPQGKVIYLVKSFKDFDFVLKIKILEIANNKVLDLANELNFIVSTGINKPLYLKKDDDYIRCSMSQAFTFPLMIFTKEENEFVVKEPFE